MGEPAGIGPEIILKSWLARHERDLPPFFITGSEAILRRTAVKLGLEIPLQSIQCPAEAGIVFPDRLPVIDVGDDKNFLFGRPSTDTASLTVRAIDKAVEYIFDRQAMGLVTAPIQKSSLYNAGFTSPGHTEYLAELCHSKSGKSESPVMMLVSGQLRVVPLTIHMALARVPQSITAELIESTCQKIHRALIRDFRLENPRITVAGLNPHAGENNAMGDEDTQIIRPAIDRLRDRGMNIRGPLPADTLFHAAARSRYDAVLCMYHDQALIPIKTLDFDGGVNVTVGLPIVRTSPDHGTALNIAGQNLAGPGSMINAIKLAERIYINRTMNHV